MNGYDVAERAQRDLDEIWTYIALRDLSAADRLADKFVSKFEMVSRQPLIGESAGHLSPGLRRVLCGNYAVYYETADERISISRVIHCARDTRRIFGETD